jgi:predicted nucleic acid-binding protein
MTYKNIFIDSDSDILLDLLLIRKPFDKFSELLVQQARNRELNLFTSTLILANIYYLLAKNSNKEIAKGQLKILSSIVQMLPFKPENVRMALDSDHVDFEDTIQFFITQKHKCEIIISRSIRHYKKFSLPVFTPEQFLDLL